jgi:aryl-alcohol dehydrogenase-like predicted oxidoreductase
VRYRKLGATGIDVSAHCLGTMMFGFAGNRDHDDCARIIHAALDRGINFLDTADMYSNGESERITGRALKGRRDEVVLATKGHFRMGEGPNSGGNSRRWILTAVERSLKRLQTDWIDLYQIHRPDHSTDIEETLSVLTDLVSQGKIRAFGCSTFPPEEIIEAHWVAERRALKKFRTEQSPYSLLARGIETSVLPVCQRHRMGVLTWSPLAGGFLSGNYRKGRPIDLTTGRPALQPERFDPAIPENASKVEIVEQLIALATEVGCTLPELALAFPIAHPAVTSVIIGPRTMRQLDDLLGAASLALDDHTLDRIDDIVPPGTDHYKITWRPPELDDLGARRRPLTDRAAASEGSFGAGTAGLPGGFEGGRLEVEPAAAQVDHGVAVRAGGDL